MPKPKVLIIAGPTATGKTALSVAIAEQLRAEIISADSRQIYRFMDIATAKPSKEELQRVPHHFIDIVNPDETYNAGQFGREGRETVQSIVSAGKTAIITGGSGLYIQALVDGFFGEVARDEEIRKRIREDMHTLGLEAVYARLRRLDPEAAARIHPNDARRIERALEVFEITGRPISELQRSQAGACPFEPVFVGLIRERSVLYAGIEQRIDRMIEQGVIEETKELLRRGYSPDLISMEGLGYREIIRYLNGEDSYEEMLRLFKQHSRNYAKRQITWFKKEKRLRWFDAGETPNQERLAQSILDYYRRS